jgi:tetratricopeptide (TPR) repeat protein
LHTGKVGTGADDPSVGVAGQTITADADADVAADDDAAGDAFRGAGGDDRRYALISEIARGGGGRIAVAIDRKLGRRVALKQPLGAGGDARLEREALVLARLEHPSIVPIHDAGRSDEGTPYYVMKMLGGDTLAARIAGSTGFEARLALLSVVTSVADAMAYAHSQGIIHRDLKPGNVLVGEFGEVVVIDWGLAKPVAGERDAVTGPLALPGVTGHGAVVGTPAYMALEQALGEVQDERADVYAIGAMLYHVLSGELPYGRVSSEATLARLIEGPPRAIEEVERRVSRELAAIVTRAMAPRPADRYRSARELADDLHRYQTGRLVAAHRYRPWTRAWRWARRHQPVLAGAALAAALAVAIVAVATRDAAGEPCIDADHAVRAAWNPVVALATQHALIGTGARSARASWQVIASELDGRARRIGALRISACRAARVTGEDSAEIFELRTACLERRTTELAGFAAWLRQADGAGVERARDELGRLSRVDDCAELAHLRELEPLPSDPLRRQMIAQIDRELDALSHLGNVPTAGTAPVVVQRATATGYGPTHARALVTWAGLLTDRGGADQAAGLLREAILVAERAGDAPARGNALRRLAELENQYHQQPAVARPLAEHALAIAEHLRDPDLGAMALKVLSTIAHTEGKDDEALRYAERAAQRQRGKNDQIAWSVQFRLGTALAQLDRFDEAERLYLALAAQEREVLGDADDPEYCKLQDNLAAIYDRRGERARALAIFETSARAVDRALPPTSQQRITTHMSVATLAAAIGKPDQAIRELEALLPTAEAALGSRHALVAQIVFELGEALQHARRFPEALARFRDAEQRFRSSEVAPISLTSVPRCREYAGHVLLELGRAREALATLREAMTALSGLHGLDSDELALTRADIARALVATGDPRGAVVELTAALPVIDQAGDDTESAVYRVTFARALWATGQRARATEVAAAARARLAKLGAEGATAMAELDAWEHAPAARPSR